MEYQILANFKKQNDKYLFVLYYLLLVGMRSFSVGLLYFESLMAVLLRKINHLIILNIQFKRHHQNFVYGIETHKDEKRDSTAVSSVYVENSRYQVV